MDTTGPDELDAMLEAATRAIEAKKQQQSERLSQRKLKEWNKGVHARLDAATPGTDLFEQLLAEVQVTPQTWIADACIVRLEEQYCTTCDTVGVHSTGWFTSYRHRSDKHSRRLVAGKMDSQLPLRVERVAMPHVDICASCAEAQVLIEEAAHKAKETQDGKA